LIGKEKVVDRKLIKIEEMMGKRKGRVAGEYLRK
jgi:hypothetical protein